MTNAATDMILVAKVSELHGQRQTRQRRVILGLVSVVLAGAALTLMFGQSFVPPADVLRILAGQEVPGADFTVRELRLPRLVLSVLTGLSFGLAGAACQTLLRNPLASPDIIGISAGAGAAAVFAIVILSWRGPSVSVLAVAVGLATALTIYLLSWRRGVAGTRLILVGIGIAAMLDSVIAWVLLKAPAWSLQEALRWLTGSVNGAQLSHAVPVLAAIIIFGGLILSQARQIEAIRLGDDKAAALGVPLARTRLLVILGLVGLVAFATSVTGPIAFVAFLSGPIAARIAGPGIPVLIPAALIGASLVLYCDFAGQFLLPGRFPVGVVTGALGAPFLIYLIIRANRTGAAT